MLLFVQFILPILLIAGLLYLKKRYTWKLLRRYHSELSGQIDVSRKYNGELTLMTNYFVQGVSIDHPSIKKSYWYAVADEILRHCEKKKNARVLFIGLGANASSLLINQHNPEIHIDIVEIDPVIIEVCKEYFHLKEMKNTTIMLGDIFEVLSSHKRTFLDRFDCIVIDTFDANPPYLLHGSHDPEFLQPLSLWLKKDGEFLFNIPIKTTGIKVPSLIQYLQEHFESVHERIIYDPRGYRNYFITAAEKAK